MSIHITTIDTTVDDDWYGDCAHDYDRDAIDAEYLEAIETSLPEGLAVDWNGDVTATAAAVAEAGSEEDLQVWVSDIVETVRAAELSDIAQAHQRSVTEAVEDDDEIRALVEALPAGYRVESFAYGAPMAHRPWGVALVEAEAWLDSDGDVRVSEHIYGADERGEVQVAVDQDGGNGSLHSATVLGQADTPTELLDLLRRHDDLASIWDQWRDEAQIRVERVRAKIEAAIRDRDAAMIGKLGVDSGEPDPAGAWDPSARFDGVRVTVAVNVPTSLDGVDEVEAEVALGRPDAGWLCAVVGGSLPMSPAEFAACRRLTGLTGDELARQMGVNPRTVRDWEQGRAPVREWAADRVRDLVAANRELAQQMIAAGAVVEIPRRTRDGDFPTAGWYLQAAATALAAEPGLAIDWGMGS